MKYPYFIFICTAYTKSFFVNWIFHSNQHLRTLPPELGNLTECFQLGLDGLRLSGIPKYARSGVFQRVILIHKHVSSESVRAGV